MSLLNAIPLLKMGDQVEIIAPASRCTDQQLADLKALLSTWGLNYIVSPDIFGDDVLCANSDKVRFELLKNALYNPETKALICARGGYGSMRLIPELLKLDPPKIPKCFVGMSDITALNLFLQQRWQWPVIHGALSQDTFSSDSITALKAILFGEKKELAYLAEPLNQLAKKNHLIEACITGGNLSLIQTSLHTPWQIESKNKIIFFEEINERGYKVDRMLEQLHQAKIFQNAAAILFGDFLKGNEPDGSSLIQPVLERFAKDCPIPVIQIKGMGHGPTNFPLILGIPAKLHLGNKIKLCL